MNDLQKYIDLVYEADDIVEIRYIWPKDVLGGGHPSSIWHLAKDLPQHAEEMSTMNNYGWGVYCGVNPRKDFNLRSDENILLARTLFFDFDDIESGDGHGSTDILLERLDDKDLPKPTLIINSGHGFHCYWRLTTPLRDLKKWADIQKGLIDTINSDRAVKNPERVMRLPGV